MASRTRPRAPAARDPEVVLRATKEPDFRQERSRRSYLALLEAATELFARARLRRHRHPRDRAARGRLGRHVLPLLRRQARGLPRDRAPHDGRRVRRDDRGADAGAVRRPRAPRDDQPRRSRSCSSTCSSRPQLTRSFTRDVAPRSAGRRAPPRVRADLASQRLTALIAAIIAAQRGPRSRGDRVRALRQRDAVRVRPRRARRAVADRAPSARKKALTDFIERALFPT